MCSHHITWLDIAGWGEWNNRTMKNCGNTTEIRRRKCIVDNETLNDATQCVKRFNMTANESLSYNHNYTCYCELEIFSLYII